MATATKKQSAIRAVVGSDESEVKRVAKEIAAELSPEAAGEFGCDTIDGAAENADQAAVRVHQAIEALLTVPFFGGDKLVWLKSVNFLADNVLGRSAAVLDSLEKLGDLLAKGLPSGVKFLISAIDGDKRRSFYKTLSKVAKVEVFDKVDATRAGWEEEVSGVVEGRAAQNGLSFTAEALELFTLLTGGDTRQIENEIEKLDIYLGAGRRKATADDVRLLVPLSRAGVIFELGNAVAVRDPKRCLSLMEQLLRQGESAIGILLVAFAPTVRNLLLVRDLMARYKLPKPQAAFHFTATLNRLPEAATQHLPRKKDGTINGYALGIAAMNADRYSTAELQSLLAACLHANVQMVTTQLDPKVVLSEMVAKLAPAC